MLCVMSVLVWCVLLDLLENRECVKIQQCVAIMFQEFSEIDYITIFANHEDIYCSNHMHPEYPMLFVYESRHVHAGKM